MPTIVCFGFPARSHTVPSLPLVEVLVGRGVEVAYHSIPRFRPLIEAAGARFVAYPAVCESLSGPADLAGHLLRVVHVTAQMLPELISTIDRRPDLVMFDGSALWGRSVARRHGVPTVSSITTFAFSRSMLQLLGGSAWGRPEDRPQAERMLWALNRDYGATLSDLLDVIVTTGDLKVVYTSPLFQPAGRFLDRSHVFVGPLLERRPREGARVAPSGPRPLAYVSLGTIFNRNIDLLKSISGTLSSAGWQVVVSLGAADADANGDWPSHVQVHPFVDQMHVVAHARLVVTHGGMNSVTEALAQGVPMIVVPQAVDQHLVARRASDLGAAVVVEPGAALVSSLEAALARIDTERAAFEAAVRRVGESFADVTSIACLVDRMMVLMTPEQGRAADVCK